MTLVANAEGLAGGTKKASLLSPEPPCIAAVASLGPSLMPPVAYAE